MMARRLRSTRPKRRRFRSHSHEPRSGGEPGSTWLLSSLKRKRSPKFSSGAHLSRKSSSAGLVSSSFGVSSAFWPIVPLALAAHQAQINVCGPELGRRGLSSLQGPCRLRVVAGPQPEQSGYHPAAQEWVLFHSFDTQKRWPDTRLMPRVRMQVSIFPAKSADHQLWSITSSTRSARNLVLINCTGWPSRSTSVALLIRTMASAAQLNSSASLAETRSAVRRVSRRR
jgi:hypothetical protein